MWLEVLQKLGTLLKGKERVIEVMKIVEHLELMTKWSWGICYNLLKKGTSPTGTNRASHKGYNAYDIRVVKCLGTC